MISSVDTTAGHTFISTDSDEMEQCLTCGGRWALVSTGGSGGRYASANGDAANECPEFYRIHGYERFCWAHDGEPCSQTDHDCNCLLCD